VNPTSFLERSPFVSPQDGTNPNRTFPGDRHGTFTEALTYHVFHELIEPSDYLIDLHGGDMVEALHPFVLFDESELAGVTATARRMAIAFGFENLIETPRAERIDGSTSAAAGDAGIPAILAEAGGRGLLEQPAVDLLSRGVRSVLRELGMLPGDPPPAPSRTLSRGFAWLYAPEAGWWRSEIEPGDLVSAGQRIGAIEDLFGDERIAIEAPADGIVLFMTSVPAVDRNGILCGLGTRREPV
jgi:predicted deacylase